MDRLYFDKPGIYGEGVQPPGDVHAASFIGNDSKGKLPRRNGIIDNFASPLIINDKGKFVPQRNDSHRVTALPLVVCIISALKIRNLGPADEGHGGAIKEHIKSEIALVRK